MLNRKSKLEKALEKFMTPKCPSEYAEQVAVVDWIKKESKIIPELSIAFHIPNGAYRDPISSARLKRAGVKPGMPDICIPIPLCGYIGLWIEMKSIKGKVSDCQAEVHELLRKLGHKVEVCIGSESAKKIIIDYLNGGRKN